VWHAEDLSALASTPAGTLVWMEDDQNMTISHRDLNQLKPLFSVFERIHVVTTHVDRAAVFAKVLAADKVLPPTIRNQPEHVDETQVAAKLKTRQHYYTSAREGYHPYLGDVRSLAAWQWSEDSRLSATMIMALAQCPWRYFLSRVAEFEPVERAPLSPDRRLLGNFVHCALEKDLEAALSLLRSALLPSVVYDAIVDEGARHVSKAKQLIEGLSVTDMVMEKTGYAFISSDMPAAQKKREGIKVRADLFGVGADGVPVFVDFKTGRPLSDAKTASTRRRHWIDAMRAGRWLQCALYLLQDGLPAASRAYYLFTSDVVTEDASEYMITREEIMSDERIMDKIRHVSALHTTGRFLPTLETQAGTEPIVCQYCDFASACSRGEPRLHDQYREIIGVNP